MHDQWGRFVCALVLTASIATAVTAQPGNYGLGAYPAVYSGNLGIGHRGGIRGYESSMFYFPRTGVSVVLLSNQGNWAIDEPMGRLVKTVLEVK